LPVFYFLSSHGLHGFFRPATSWLPLAFTLSQRPIVLHAETCHALGEFHWRASRGSNVLYIAAQPDLRSPFSTQRGPTARVTPARGPLASGRHIPYDIFLIGNGNSYTWQDLIPDGGRIHYDGRSSRGRGRSAQIDELRFTARALPRREVRRPRHRREDEAPDEHCAK
jgi:hypothetical protein